jgi:serine/threonine-protein kinase HipA
MSKRCLYCYQPLSDVSTDFHEKCSLSFFGTRIPPALDYSITQMHELANEIVVRSVAVTGVQPKLSLTIEPQPNAPKRYRFTIVGLWGNYILKPPTEEYSHLPENEDLTMHLAQLLGITTAAHSLIRLKSGELAYLTNRFDREGKEKLAQEDLCQLTETLTADKYQSSMEKVGKHIALYSSRPGLDVILFFELALFSFLTGNADMHLKNFSLLTTEKKDVVLSPAYDLLCTRLALPEDMEEMALTLNGKKRKLNRNDFDALAKSLKLPEKTINNSYTRLARKLEEALTFMEISFLPDTLKNEYKKIFETNAKRLEL